MEIISLEPDVICGMNTPYLATAAQCGNVPILIIEDKCIRKSYLQMSRPTHGLIENIHYYLIQKPTTND